MKEILLDIVNLPPKHIRSDLGQRTVKAARELQTVYLVDDVDLIPHQSVFHVKILENNFSKFDDRLDKILTDFVPFSIRSTGTTIVDSVVGVTLIEPPELRNLHETVVEKLYDLRSGEMPWNPKREPNDLEQGYRKQYGTQHIFQNFKPHISLAKFNNETDAEVFQKNFGDIEFSYNVDTIAICEVNALHQVTRIIKEYKLN